MVYIYFKNIGWKRKLSKWNELDNWLECSVVMVATHWRYHWDNYQGDDNDNKDDGVEKKQEGDRDVEVEQVSSIVSEEMKK